MAEHKQLPCCNPELVAACRAALPTQQQVTQLAKFFSIIGDGTRVRILWALDAGEICVCDLALLLGMTKSAVSHQLRALKNARLIKGRRVGKHIYYSLDDEHMRAVFETAVEHLKHQQA